MEKPAWLFLYYKALCLNDTYRTFCVSMAKSDMRQVESLLKENHLLLSFFRLFGDLSANYHNVNEKEHFTTWLKEYGKNFIPARYKRFDIVNAGESIVPEQGVVYFTVPSDASAEAARLFYGDLLAKAVEAIDKSTEKRFLPLTQTGGWASRERIHSTKKQLDLYFWAEYEVNYYNKSKPALRDIIELAADSGKDQWKVLKSTIEQLKKSAAARANASARSKAGLTRTELDGIQATFSKDIKKGKRVVENAAKGYFPSPKTHKEAASDILQGFDVEKVDGLFS